MNPKKIDSYIFTLVIIAVQFISPAAADDMSEVKQKVDNRDPRNGNVVYSLTQSGEDLRYCVEEINGEAGPIDVFRVLLHTADELKNESFARISLCYRGEDKYFLSGTEFKQIGMELESQNPMYVVRTFPEKLTLPGGQRAFEAHRGGVLYLLRAQMEDFNEMHRYWYLDAMLAERKAVINESRPKEFAAEDEVF